MHWTTVTTASLVIAAGYLLWFGLLLRHRTTATKSTGTSTRQRIRALGLEVLLLPWVVALAGLVGSAREFAPLVLPGLALALWTFAPRRVTAKVVPLALVGVGLEGFRAWP
jgi:uncharacterized membrane protein